MNQNLWQFINDPANHYWSLGWQFTSLCLAAILGAIVLAVPLGIVVARQPVLAFIASNISGLFRAIPTVAILFGLFLLPRVGGFGFRPAVIALIVIGIPPILLNAVAAVRSIDPATLDAARGMGMSPWQVVTRVEVPLALPVILAGIRTAAVQIIATAPLGAWIGAGGWGLDIELGLYFTNNTLLVAGALPVAILALLAEFLLAAAQRAVTPRGVRLAQSAVAEAIPSAASDAASQVAPV